LAFEELDVVAKHRFSLILFAVLIALSLWTAQTALAQSASACPLTQGYWANHAESWPVTSIMLGSQFYAQGELLALLPGGGGDASTILAVQLASAKLSIAAGAESTTISAALLQADTLLGQFAGKLPYIVDPSSTLGQAMVNLAAILDLYNNGQLTPNCIALPTATSTPTPIITPATQPPTATLPAAPVSTPVSPCAGGILLNGFNVAYGGRAYDPAADQTTFAYTVCGTSTPPDLSHFDVEIPVCPAALNAVSYSPTDAVSLGVDPTTAINGIKWDLPLLTTETRSYSVTFGGNVVEGSVQVAVKGGNGFLAGSLPGPSCVTPSIDVEKFVSTDNSNWQDADDLPGPDVRLDMQVFFRFVVTNDGNVPLSNLVLTDSILDVSGCTEPATLDPGVSFECAAGPFPAAAGQHTNTATALGIYQAETLSDSDGANYFGGDRPAVDVEKFVSSDGTTWADVDSAPGPQLIVGSSVSFRFVVTNSGTVALANVTLSDDRLDLSACAIPTMLDAGASAECIVGPIQAVEGQHSNTATVSADFNGTVVTDTDAANYLGGQTSLPVTIIVEGPVQIINVNIITIYDIDIEVNVNDPILSVLQIGDVVRVEGDTIINADTLVVVAISIVVINVDVVVNVDGVVWRDQGNCSNPPPPWAPANGWRRRCEAPNVIIISNNDDDGMGMGMGMGNDD
jgi:hypothetical protein